MSVFCGTVGLVGCTNEFLASYRGERFAPSASPRLVNAKPADAGLIGASDFVGGGALGDPEALAAASEVGADFVQWSRGLDSADGPAGAGVVRASLSPSGPVSSWAPVQPGEFLYRYAARFYRTGVKDGAIAPAKAVPVSDDGQMSSDEAAANQEVRSEAAAPRH